MDKKELYYKTELLVDRSIPYLVIFLLCLIISEFFFRKQTEPYSFYINLVDYFIVGVFCLDLIFKYLKVRKIPEFLKHHWIDILAVFPFFLIFRLFEEMYLISNLPALLTQPPTLLHESLVLEKEGIRLLRVTERLGQLSRTRIIVSLIRPLQRLPRLLKIIPYFEKPTREHHKTIEEIGNEKLKSIKH